MALDAGFRLGPYEIVAPLGAGGMGEVYRARDTRLDRTVAIKVLPASLAADPQLRERFDREARAISALNHPHICTLHDVGHQDPSTGSGPAVDYIVLEYLEGETLADRVAAGGPDRRALPVDDALTIAIQVADALDRAHRSGIVHRDLKPANIFLVRRGTSGPVSAKLLDFGLAKTAAPVIATSGLSMAPTTPPNLTAQGTILGTFQYMAPEQIEGLEADARTDIFAFGAVLFEMLAGRPAFEGKTRAQLLGAILKDEPPPVSSLVPSLSKDEPAAPGSTRRQAQGSPRAELLNRIVATCLAKDPDDRWQTARDLLRELKWVSAVGPAKAGPHVLNSANRTWGPPLGGPTAWAILGILTIALIATGTLALRHLRETPSARETYQFTISPPDSAEFGGPPGGGTGVATQLAISPDGRLIVFVAKTKSTYSLWLRPLTSLQSREIPGTEGAAFPFWSPDSRFIGFFAAGKLKKVTVAGGPPTIVCDAPTGRGGSWSQENVILFTPETNRPLHRVSSAGGAPVAAAVIDTTYGETSHRWPHFLPDGRHFLYTGVTGACCPAVKPGRIKIGALDTTETSTLLQADSGAVFSAGHLLFNRDGVLMAQPFDWRTRQITAEAFPVVERVSREGSRYSSFGVSANGVLLYAGGADASEPDARLTWVDRAGRVLGTVGDPARYNAVALSPDGNKAVATITGGAPRNNDIWVIDLRRAVSSRLTFSTAGEIFPIWSPDSARVIFTSVGTADAGLRVKVASGTLNDELLLKGNTESITYAEDWSEDGRFIAYATTASAVNGTDLWILPLTGERKPFPFVAGPRQQGHGSFAPDTRWIAYTSDESNFSQVYVQPFPATGGRFQVSRDGGSQPQWRGDGKELIFVALDGTLMSVSIETAREFQAGMPRALFGTGMAPTNRRQYGVTRDGARFLIITPERSPGESPLTVSVNWLAAVQR